MKVFKRSLAVILALCMMLGVVPFTAFASENTSAYSNTTFERILHLDCGRKYFTADWIKALINEMAAAGYTHLQLAFGNDGLRFLLDDMSVGSYSDDQVTAAIKQGNKDYYDFDTNELTQSEMDEIIAHAQVQGIKIIPLLNNPGHMNAIVSAATSLTGEAAGYNGSGSTVNLENTAALSFVKGLVTKYINYFAEKGCDEFNMGADEYANDVYPTGSMGFGALVSAGKYQLFVKYVNDMADLIDDAGMTPIAFNDGIYFNQDTSYNFNKGIKVAFWTSGWTGYQSAPASEMARLGHQMINVNGAYYYVLGKNDKWTPGETTTHNPDLYTEAGSWINSGFMGSEVSDPAGAMFCIWCDYPNAETETQIAANTRMILRAMAAEMKGEDGTAVDTDVVTGGFDTNGNITGLRELETVTDSSVDVTVTGFALTELNVVEEDAPEIEGASNVKAWDITPKAGNSNYTEAGIVKLPVPSGWNTERITGFYVENGEVVLVNGTYEDGYYTFRMPHFSVAGIYDTERAAEGDDGATPDTENRTINLILGETTTDAIEGGDYRGTYNTEPEGIAAVTAEYEQVEGGKSPVRVTDVFDGSAYYLSDGNGNYLTSNASWTTNINNAAQWTLYEDTYYHDLYLYTNNKTAWLYYYDNSWQIHSSYGDPFSFSSDGAFVHYSGSDIKLIPYIIINTAPVNQTTVTFTGTSIGSATVDIGSVHYTVNVDYAEKTINIVKNGSRTEEQSVTVANYMDVTSMTNDYVTATWSGNTVTFTAKNQTGRVEMIIGNTKYTVYVIEENLDNVAPLTIEYWQTNAQAEEQRGNGKTSKTVTAESAYSEEGIDLTSIIPVNTYKVGSAATDPGLNYWRSRLLSRATNEQTGANGDDETLNGTGFTKVRYWNGSWAVYTDEGVWLEIAVDAYQLVAYYMNDMRLADEVSVGTSDWGKKGNGEFGNTYLGASNVSLAFQIVYEDGTTAPAGTGTELAPYTYFVDHWGNRGVGTVAINQIGDYMVWKITAETGEHSVTHNGNNNPVTVRGFTWDGNEMTVWEDAENPVDHYTILNPTSNPNTEGYYDNLRWNEENESILIRIYIKAVETETETEDTLKVVYFDEKFGDTLVEYNVVVPKDNNFNNAIVLANSTTSATLPTFATNENRKDATGYGIVNALNKTQNFRTDLTQVPEAVGKYNNGLYTYTGSVVSDGGKTITHYYTINTNTLSPNFVVDFGLPLTFPLSRVIGENQEVIVESVTVNPKTRYGTLAYDSVQKIFTYKPTEILQNIDVLSITIKFTTEQEATLTNVGVTPATTVYYEEGFLFTDTDDLTGWTGTDNFGGGTQAAEVLGESTHYGYDSAYAGDATGSDGTCAVATVTGGVGAYTSFTFTGTGFELYANSDNSSGIVTVLKQGGEISKLYRIDTILNPQTAAAYALSNTAADTYYSLPIISETDLAYGTYTVQIKQNNTQKVDGKIYIDGVRIINTLNQPDNTEEEIVNIYTSDLEDSPEFYELRDYVLRAMGVENTEGIDVSQMAGQVYEALGTTDEAKAIVLDARNKIYDDTVQALLNDGPKNELYLAPGQTLTFKVTTNRVMQLGLKSPVGNAKFTLTVQKAGDENATKLDLDAFNGSKNPDITDGISNFTSTVDMFYEIAGKPQDGAEKEYTVTITVNSGLLSVTKLKICDDPNAAFVALTQEDIENALLGIYGLTDDKTPVEPEEPAAEADAVLAITLTDGKKEMGTAELTAVGAEGEKHTFTAEEILNAVLDAMPDLYKVSDESAITDVIVKYGETGEITVDIELEFEFDMDSWWRQVRTLMNRIFTIIADAGNGGSITNEGSADVKFRKDITYTITPDEGYEIESVIVDGKDVGAVSEYTFRRVRNDHRISVTFKEVQ